MPAYPNWSRKYTREELDKLPKKPGVYKLWWVWNSSGPIRLERLKEVGGANDIRETVKAARKSDRNWNRVTFATVDDWKPVLWRLPPVEGVKKTVRGGKRPKRRTRTIKVPESIVGYLFMILDSGLDMWDISDRERKDLEKVRDQLV